MVSGVLVMVFCLYIQEETEPANRSLVAYAEPQVFADTVDSEGLVQQISDSIHPLAETDVAQEPSRAFGFSDEHDAEKCVPRIEKLVAGSGSLNALQRSWLVGFLEQKICPSGVVEARWIELKNRAWNRLRSDPGGGDDLPRALFQVLDDRTQPEVCRNYAVQHLGMSVIEGLIGRPGLDRLWKAVEENENSIGGTALICLAHVCAEIDGAQGELIDGAVVRVLQDSRSSESTLIAALQVASERSVRGGCGMALSIFRDTSRSIPLRMAAASCCVAAGDSRMIRKILEKTDFEKDDRLRRMLLRVGASVVGER